MGCPHSLVVGVAIVALPRNERDDDKKNDAFHVHMFMGKGIGLAWVIKRYSI